MTYDILVTKHLNNGYSARPLVWPELVLSGASEAEVVGRVRTALADFLTHSHVVRVDVEPIADESDPWLRYAGIWQDLPEDEWNEYLTAVNDFRAEMDKQSQDATLSEE